ncbi:MAG TPA: ActD-like protein [Polyangia bacterium]|nr:ActD-like protein [Polyangia bacterium]
MQRDKRSVPDWLLERLALGELDAAAAADVRRRLAAEGRSPDDILAAVAASNRELLAQRPAAQAAEAIRRRAATAAAAEQPARRRAFLWGAPLALAGGAALVLFVMVSGLPDGRGTHHLREAPEIILEKGGPASPTPRLFVYRHGPAANQSLADGARAARGDLVQLAYRNRERAYGVLLSIDGAGKVTLHWPEKQDGPAASLQIAGEIRLPSSYELDDAPDFERFFLVRAAAPFSVTTALDAARALAAQPSARRQALTLPPGFEQISLALDKPSAGKKESP